MHKSVSSFGLSDLHNYASKIYTILDEVSKTEGADTIVSLVPEFNRLFGALEKTIQEKDGHDAKDLRLELENINNRIEKLRSDRAELITKFDSDFNQILTAWRTEADDLDRKILLGKEQFNRLTLASENREFDAELLEKNLADHKLESREELARTQTRARELQEEIEEVDFQIAHARKELDKKIDSLKQLVEFLRKSHIAGGDHP